MAGQGLAGQAWHGKAWLGKAWLGKARLGRAGSAWHGMARLGSARSGAAWQAGMNRVDTNERILTYGQDGYVGFGFECFDDCACIGGRRPFGPSKCKCVCVNRTYGSSWRIVQIRRCRLQYTQRTRRYSQLLFLGNTNTSGDCSVSRPQWLVCLRTLPIIHVFTFNVRATGKTVAFGVKG